ncbi:MAG: hypothetical protein JO117_09175 [Verrucomicrobia bacterium]|nr:hypothetical protein [Verrucomicrobiota bacterium]
MISRVSYRSLVVSCCSRWPVMRLARLLATVASGFAALAMLSACAHRGSRGADVELQSGRGTIGTRGNVRTLQAEIRIEPNPVKLGETRMLDVTLIVRNKSKKAVPLKFATTQRIELLIRQPGTDKVLSQWSADRTFDPKGFYLIVNPNERLEYKEQITTRELKPGKPYDVEAYLVGYDRELHVTQTLTPQP